MQMIRKISILMRSLFVVWLCFIVSSCSKKQEKRAFVRAVKVAQVQSSAEIKKDFSGVVEAIEYVKLAFRVSGQIVELPVVEGQKVKKGDLIAKIDPREISLQYAADKAAYETATSQLQRNESLLEKPATSGRVYEVCNATYVKDKVA